MFEDNDIGRFVFKIDGCKDECRELGFKAECKEEEGLCKDECKEDEFKLLVEWIDECKFVECKAGDVVWGKLGVGKAGEVNDDCVVAEAAAAWFLDEFIEVILNSGAFWRFIGSLT